MCPRPKKRKIHCPVPDPSTRIRKNAIKTEAIHSSIAQDGIQRSGAGHGFAFCSFALNGAMTWIFHVTILWTRQRKDAGCDPR